MTKPMTTADKMKQRAQHLGAATLHEAAGRIGALPSAIKPVNPRFRVCGPAFTVHGPAYDNLWIHRAIYDADPGDVLVVSTSGGIEAGYWGEILSEAAIARGLGGLVIEGGVRDVEVLYGQDFPVFSHGVCLRGTSKDFGGTGWLNAPIRIGNVTINAGDVVAGDVDGVVVLPSAAAPTIFDAAERRLKDEEEKIKEIRAGAQTIDLYSLGAADDSARWLRRR